MARSIATPPGSTRRLTLGADKGCDVAGFVAEFAALTMAADNLARLPRLLAA